MHFSYNEVGLLIKAIVYYLARHSTGKNKHEAMRELLEKLYRLGV